MEECSARRSRSTKSKQIDQLKLLFLSKYRFLADKQNAKASLVRRSRYVVQVEDGCSSASIEVGSVWPFASNSCYLYFKADGMLLPIGINVSATSIAISTKHAWYSLDRRQSSTSLPQKIKARHQWEFVCHFDTADWNQWHGLVIKR